MHSTLPASHFFRTSFASALLVALALLSPNAAEANALDHLQTMEDIGPNKVPNRGQSNILVLVTRVGVPSFPPDEWARLQQQFDPEGGPGTFREFWQVQSRGAFDPVPFIADPVLFPDECPIPGKTLGDCFINLQDFSLLTTGAIRDLFQLVLERVRDEQGIDLSQFDINGKDGEPDGHFDGIILDTDFYVPLTGGAAGLGIPLVALGQEVTVEPRPIGDDEDAGIVDGGASDAGVTDGGPTDGGFGDGGPSDGGSADDPDAGPSEDALVAGLISLVPPANHEFGHNLGFIDLYGGPQVNGLMFRSDLGLSAFSRMQIGWGEVVEVSEAGTIELPPVLDDGTILKFGDGERYVLVENRGGEKHVGAIDRSVPGLYFHSIDESQFPQGPLGFLDLINGTLALPNEDPPYLNVTLPLNCQVYSLADPNSCTLTGEGARRDVVHQGGEHQGFYIEQGPTAEDGTITIFVREGEVPVEEPDAGLPDAGASEPEPEPSAEPDPATGCGGCSATPAEPSLLLLAFAMVGLWRRRRARARTVAQS